MRNHSYENGFDLHENEPEMHENETACRAHFHMKGFTQIRFETETGTRELGNGFFHRFDTSNTFQLLNSYQ